MLCRTVEKTDYFVRISNVASFACQMANVIVVLYSLLFFEYPSIMVECSILVWLFVNAFGLAMATYNGIAVNVAVTVNICCLCCTITYIFLGYGFKPPLTFRLS